MLTESCCKLGPDGVTCPGTPSSARRRFRLLSSSAGRVAALALGLITAGCGGEPRDDLPREAIWGKVTFEGEPLARGAIRLRTSTPGDSHSLEVGGLIRDGQYSIPRAEGPVPGTYLVSITEEVESKLPAGEAPGPFIRQKPSRLSSLYNNTQSTLKAEVKAGQADAIDFDLKKSTESQSANSNIRPR